MPGAVKKPLRLIHHSRTKTPPPGDYHHVAGALLSDLVFSGMKGAL
jgi:hypothetical protein